MDRLHVDVHEGREPFLLLVHGFLSSRAMWLDNLAGLSAFCRPVTAELWGHGRSPAPDAARLYTVEGYVDQFERIRADLGAARWLVCGQSFGAGLAMGYALANPGAVAGLVVTNSMSGFAEPAARPAAQREAAARAVEDGGAAGLAENRLHPRHAKRLGPAVSQALLADAERLSPRGIAQAIRHTVPGLAVGPALAGLSVPALLVNGVWEKAFQPLRAALPQRCPAFDIVDLPGGHAINAEAPKGFAEAVGAFIERGVESFLAERPRGQTMAPSPGGD
jgi:pimeloyl-ACP methyl ester carboxylesterase